MIHFLAYHYGWGLSDILTLTCAGEGNDVAFYIEEIVRTLDNAQAFEASLHGRELERKTPLDETSEPVDDDLVKRLSARLREDMKERARGGHRERN